MSVQVIKQLGHLSEEIATALISHVAPTGASDGVDITSWLRGGYKPNACIAYIGTASEAIAITAGAYWAGYDPTTGEWYRVRTANDGSAIALTTGVGYAEKLIDIGWASRLALVDTGDTGTHLYGFTPLETLEG